MKRFKEYLPQNLIVILISLLIISGIKVYSNSFSEWIYSGSIIFSFMGCITGIFIFNIFLKYFSEWDRNQKP